MNLKPFHALAIASPLILLMACGGSSKNTPPGPSVVVTINPSQQTVLPGNSFTFKATVSNTENKTVAWSILEPSGGSIDSTGLYTAPASGGPYHVIATSMADPSKSSQSIVTLGATSHISVALDLNQKTLGTGQQQAFQATVSGDTTQAGVVWSVLEPEGGSVDAQGLYTAPMEPGTYHLRAASKTDSTKFSLATLQILDATTPATNIEVQVASLDSSQWRIIPKDRAVFGLWGLDLSANPDEVFFEIHAPAGSMGRGFAFNIVGDSDTLELERNRSALNFGDWIPYVGTTYSMPTLGASIHQLVLFCQWIERPNTL